MNDEERLNIVADSLRAAGIPEGEDPLMIPPPRDGDTVYDEQTAQFENWLKRVDDLLWRVAQIAHHNDLPDQDWRDWFSDGLTPSEAVKEALDNEGFPGTAQDG